MTYASKICYLLRKYIYICLHILYAFICLPNFHIFHICTGIHGNRREPKKHGQNPCLLHWVIGLQNSSCGKYPPEPLDTKNRWIFEKHNGEWYCETYTQTPESDPPKPPSRHKSQIQILRQKDRPTLRSTLRPSSQIRPKHRRKQTLAPDNGTAALRVRSVASQSAAKISRSGTLLVTYPHGAFNANTRRVANAIKLTHEQEQRQRQAIVRSGFVHTVRKLQGLSDRWSEPIIILSLRLLRDAMSWPLSLRIFRRLTCLAELSVL